MEAFVVVQLISSHGAAVAGPAPNPLMHMGNGLLLPHFILFFAMSSMKDTEMQVYNHKAQCFHKTSVSFFFFPVKCTALLHPSLFLFASYIL